MERRWILSVVVLVHLVQCKEQNDIENFEPNIYEPSWMYECVPDMGCEKSAHPLPTSSFLVNTTSNLFVSLDVCRTVCGRFGGIWPKPITATLSSQTVKIHPDKLTFNLDGVPVSIRDFVTEMTQVIRENLVAECEGNVTEISDNNVVVHITVNKNSTVLDWDTDEQYMLDVQVTAKQINVHVVGNTVYGARHGLETFTQLVASEKPQFTEKYRCSLHLVAGANVKDRPVYRHRGFLLDTSRNFVPLDDIKRMIDGLAATKMNVFHWHVTDSHSFPLQSVRVPQFTRYGAYSMYEIYTTEEVKDLISYAQVRGVRVIIEIDSPAHAGNGWQWGREYGLGDLAVCVNEKQWRNFCIQPPCGQMNPANPALYRVLRNLYRDIVEQLPSPPLLHMGGDEVFFNCWNSSDDITNYMKGKGFEISVDGFIRLWAEFHVKTLQLWDEEVKRAGKGEELPVMLWSSELTQAHRIQNYLDKKRYIIEVWEPETSPLLDTLLSLGYRTVSVPKDVWYLDHGFWGNTIFSNWRRMYLHTIPAHQNMLGGEVAMWSEYVDSQGLDTRVWPRTAAVGERLWSDSTRMGSMVAARLERQRGRLLARGLRPDVLAPAWCAQHDSRCQ